MQLVSEDFARHTRRLACRPSDQFTQFQKLSIAAEGRFAQNAHACGT
jgi:hypothetical protein